MLEIVETIYKDGVFVPEKPLNFPEGMKIKIVVETFEQKQLEEAESVVSNEEKSRLLSEFVKQMQKNQIPLDAPRFTREELYDRR